MVLSIKFIAVRVMPSAVPEDEILIIALIIIMPVHVQ